MFCCYLFSVSVVVYACHLLLVPLTLLLFLLTLLMMFAHLLSKSCVCYSFYFDDAVVDDVIAGALIVFIFLAHSSIQLRLTLV